MGGFLHRCFAPKLFSELLVTQARWTSYCKIGVAMHLSCFVFEGIANYRCHTPFWPTKNTLSQRKGLCKQLGIRFCWGVLGISSYRGYLTRLDRILKQKYYFRTKVRWCPSTVRLVFPILVFQLSKQQNRTRTTSSTVLGTPPNRTQTKKFPFEEL